MTRVNLEELEKAIGPSDVSERIAGAGKSLSISIPSANPFEFVEPGLMAPGEDGIPEAQVYLIAAPAAVGKSSLARELAYRTQNLLWDLADYSVGSGFFSGTLFDTFGASVTDSLRSGLLDGTMTLLIDSADEAHVRAGAQSFRAGIENLSGFVGSKTRRTPSAVIFGRPDTISDIKSYLSEFGLSSIELDVTYFDHDRAVQFVTVKAGGGHQGVAKSELTGFLDNFFLSVQSALGAKEWHESESFLGYAPVLDALAAFYRGFPNPLRKLMEISKAKSSAHVWSLLHNVLWSILQRESDKFAASFGADNEAKANFGAACYSPATQISMLIADDPSSVTFDIPDDESVDPIWLDDIEEKLLSWFREHPFLGRSPQLENPLLRFANVAFRDFIIAQHLAMAGPDAAAVISDHWSDPLVTPSPMFSRFALDPETGLRVMTGATLALIIDSHSSQAPSSVYLEVDVFKQDGQDSAEVSVTTIESSAVASMADFVVEDLDTVSLPRRLSSAGVFWVGGKVELGYGARDFTIGPLAFIVCETLHVESAELRPRAEQNRPNFVFAGRVAGSVRKISSPPETLSVVVPRVFHPWQPYRVDRASLGSGGVPDRDLLAYAMEIRRTTKWFVRESMVGGGLNYPVDGMDSIIRKGRASADVHAFLLERGYLKRRAQHWELEFPRFGGRVVIENQISDPDYRSLLVDYAQWAKKESL